LSLSKASEYVRKSITIDKGTLLKIESFRAKRGLDFSSCVRLIINEYVDKL